MLAPGEEITVHVPVPWVIELPFNWNAMPGQASSVGLVTAAKVGNGFTVSIILPVCV